MKRIDAVGVGLAIVAAALLAGCASGGSSGAKTLHASLSGTQEVPPVAGKGTGTADLTLDPATKKLSWKVSYSGLSSDAAAAHIHGPAAPGANAGVVVNLGPNGMKNPLEGSATLTDAQVADLVAGKDYINIHTPQNKGGEIRGQITP
jgi:hypothetical protein